MTTLKPETNLEKYKNLSSWTDTEWQSLDIFRFIAANWRRYAAMVIKRVGSRQAPTDILDWLQGIFIDLSHAPLTVVHARHKDATGERRNQIMLGTLKAIAATRVVEAVVEEFPFHLPLETFMGVEDSGEFHQAFETSPANLNSPHTLGDTDWDETDMTHPAFLWNPEDMTGEEDSDQHTSNGYPINALRIEWLRSHLTPAQYRVLHFMLVEGMDFDDIAIATDVGVSNVRIMMLHAREKLLSLMPSDMALKHQGLRTRTRTLGTGSAKRHAPRRRAAG
jgi:hypothetical protein